MHSSVLNFLSYAKYSPLEKQRRKLYRSYDDGRNFLGKIQSFRIAFFQRERGTEISAGGKKRYRLFCEMRRIKRGLFALMRIVPKIPRLICITATVL